MNMMSTICSYLTAHTAFALFLCLGLGYLMGKVKIKSFVVGATAGTLLVGLIISQFVSIDVQQPLSTVLFSLFCFTVGFDVGPSFFSSLRSTGLKVILLAVFFAAVGLGTAWALSMAFGLDVGSGVGLLAGALTQTSILGAAQLDEAMASNATIAYALTYVFGTLGVILFVKSVAPLMLKKSLPEIVKAKVDKTAGKVSGEPLALTKDMVQVRAYVITPESRYCGGRVGQFEAASGGRIEIEGVYRGEWMLGAGQDQELLAGDVIQVVGDVDALNLADDYGLHEVSDPKYFHVQLIDAKIVLTADFTENGQALLSEHGVLARHIGRGVSFRKGSIISVKGPAKAIGKAARLMGYVKDEGNATDIPFLSLAIAVGLFIGSLAIVLGDLSLSLGESVGVLLSGLVCGWWYDRRPRVGHIPAATRVFLKSLGLNLYIAALALRVGGSFQQAMTGNGWIILLLGVLVTLIPHVLSLLFGKYVLRIDDADLLGGLCGSGTCTAALNALTDETNSSVFALGYAPGCAAGNVLLTVIGLILPMLM